MNIKALRLFVSVMENTTLSKASENLHISQPAASRLIRLLEEQVGEMLFFRTRKKLVPTPEAELLLPEATRILNGIDNIPTVMARSRSENVLPLRILCLPRIVDSLVIPALAALDVNDRTRRYKVEVCPRREFGRRLLHGNYDVGVSSVPIPIDIPQTQFLASAHLVVMLPKDHRFACRETLSPKDLQDERYIALDQHTVVRQAVDKALALNETHLEMAHEVSNSDVAQWFVRRGMGFTFVDPAAVDASIMAEVALVPCSLLPEIKMAYFLPDVRRPHPYRNEFLHLLAHESETRYSNELMDATKQNLRAY